MFLDSDFYKKKCSKTLGLNFFLVRFGSWNFSTWSILKSNLIGKLPILMGQTVSRCVVLHLRPARSDRRHDGLLQLRSHRNWARDVRNFWIDLPRRRKSSFQVWLFGIEACSRFLLQQNNEWIELAIRMMVGKKAWRPKLIPLFSYLAPQGLHWLGLVRLCRQ